VIKFYDFKLENPCNTAPCLNGGVCTPVNDEDLLYKCTCPSGCNGKRCESCKNGCSTNTCQNNGICQINLLGFPFCVCANGYTGIYCQTCKNKPFIILEVIFKTKFKLFLSI
jgi:hypothetical protein